MQDSAEICTLKNSHARQNSPTSLMISKRLVMVCVGQETSNAMFTILSLCLVSVNVLEPVRGAPGHVTNPGYLKMHQPGASGMLRCTAL